MTGFKFTFVPVLTDKEKGVKPPIPPRTHDKPDPLKPVSNGFAVVPVLIRIKPGRIAISPPSITNPVESIDQGPISPEVAVIVPLKFPSVAVKTPSAVTLNLPLSVSRIFPDPVALPSINNFGFNKILEKKAFPETLISPLLLNCIAVPKFKPALVIFHPPIVPVFALILPEKLPLVAVIAPVTDKLDPSQVKLPPEGLPILSVPLFAFVKKKPLPVLNAVALALRIVP